MQRGKVSCGSRNSGLWNVRPGLQDHSGLMLAARITLPHFSVSSAMNLPKSAGEPGNAIPPRSASRAFRHKWAHITTTGAAT
jgi:hypothetical protein